MDNDKITIKIKSSEAVIFEGEAQSLSSINEQGAFDILPYHGNFFSIIKEKVTINDEKNKKIEIIIKDNGIMRVVENKISVFLGIETIELQ